MGCFFTVNYHDIRGLLRSFALLKTLLLVTNHLEPAIIRSLDGSKMA